VDTRNFSPFDASITESKETKIFGKKITFFDDNVPFDTQKLVALS
jgi:hypothetical protein